MTTTTEALMALAEDFADHYRSDKRDEIRAELASALAEVVKDAERYRWLTETLGDTPHGKPSLSAAWDDDIDDWRSARFFGLRDEADVDAAIDAALAARGAEQKGGVRC